MVIPRRLDAAVAVLMLAAATHPLHAQMIRGQTLEAGTNRPIESALVSLIDASGLRVRTAWTDVSGRFVLRAPSAGAYTLRVDRIGFESATSPVLQLAADQTLDYRMEVPMEAITLPNIDVLADGRGCPVRPDETAEATARVWAEARKALSAAVKSEREGTIRFEGVTFLRVLDRDRSRVLEEVMRPYSGFYEQPFESRPAEELATAGYVREVEYGRYFDFFAPSAEVLLSNSFVDTHCMRLESGQGATQGLVGLAFHPVRGRNIPDIEGTFWLDPHSAHLRFLEFRYVAPSARYPTVGAGGRVDFATLPNGAWFVRRWAIRMPLMEEVSLWGGATGSRMRVVAMQEEGGEITRVYLPSGQQVDVAVRVRLEGMVYDSTSAAPLGGASVRLTGTTYRTVADPAGRFRIDEVPPGIYGIEFTHPRLDSLPVAALPPVEVTVTADSVVPIVLAVPSLGRILAAACPAPDGDAAHPGTLPGEPTGVLVGMVRDPRTGLAVSNAPVTLAWSRYDVGPTDERTVAVARASWNGEAVTSESGRFWTCNLPRDIPIHARATLPDGRPLETMLRITSPIQVVTLGAGAAAPAETRAVAGAAPGAGTGAVVDAAAPTPVSVDVGRGAFQIVRADPRADGATVSTLWGQVVDGATGEPVVDAEVVLLAGPGLRDGETPGSRTGANGEFLMRRLEPGNFTVEFRHPAYDPIRSVLDLEASGDVVVRVELAARPIDLDAVEVTAEARRGPEALRSISPVHRVAGTTLADARTRGSRLVDVIRGFPGLSVREGVFETIDGAESGICVESTRRLARLMAPTAGGAPFCESLVVVVDGVRVRGAVQYLLSLRLEDVQSVELLSSMDGAIRYGPDAASSGGVLLIQTRSSRR